MSHKKKKESLSPTAASENSRSNVSGPNAQFPSVLLDACFDGRCVLFLGAGASLASIGPTWQRLLEDIAARFSAINHDRVTKYFLRHDPWGAADLVCNNAPRPELNTFVRNRLERLQPSSAHETLTTLPWAAIYTTNFDVLIEKAYEKHFND